MEKNKGEAGPCYHSLCLKVIDSHSGWSIIDFFPSMVREYFCMTVSKSVWNFFKVNNKI